MTIQVNDTVEYQGTEYEIASCTPEGVMFSPWEHGLKPVGKWTGCLRGFGCRYEIRADALLLVFVGLHCNGTPPGLFGVAPLKSREERYWDAVYQDLSHHVSFTGSVLLGKPCKESRDGLSLGWPPAWAYRTLVEVRFEAGQLTNALDRSREMEHIRQRNETLRRHPPDRDGITGLRRWIRSNFDSGHWLVLLSWLPTLPEDLDLGDLPPPPPGVQIVP